MGAQQTGWAQEGGPFPVPHLSQLNPALPGVVSPGGICPLPWGNPLLGWTLAGGKEVEDTIGRY